MKKYIVAVGVVTLALVGCEDSSNTMEEAKESATQMVETVKETVEGFDLESLDLTQFGDAGEQVKALGEAVQEVLATDFTDLSALAAVKDKVANAYSCLVGASSETTAQEVIGKLLSSVTDQEAVDVIEEGVEQGSDPDQCTM